MLTLIISVKVLQTIAMVSCGGMAAMIYEDIRADNAKEWSYE
jgi:hypothetical protein